MLTPFFSLLRTHFLRLISMSMIFAVVIIMITLVDQIITNIDTQISTQTKPIVGADMIISSSQPITGEILQYLESNNHIDKALQGIQFYSTIGQETDPKLVQIKGIQSGYPLYGAVDIEYLTGGHMAHLDTGNPVWVSLQSGVYIDQQTYNLINQSGFIQLGQLNLPILGVIKKQATLGFSFLDEGRTILIPYDIVKATQLTDLGSRVSYEIQIKLKNESQGLALKKEIETRFPKQYQVSLASQRIAQLTGIIDQLNQYTSTLLIITIMLSLAIMSIASMTMTNQIKQAIAVMRVLGCSKTKILSLCLLLFGSMFVLALVVGIAMSYLFFQSVSYYDIAKDFVRQSANLWKIFAVAAMSFMISCWQPLRYLVDTHPLTLLKSSETQISKTDEIIGFLLFIGGSTLILWLLTGALLFSIMVIFGLLLLAISLYYIIIVFFRFIYTRAKKFRESHFGRFDAIRQTILPGNQTAVLVGGLLLSLLTFCVITSISLSFIDRLRISSLDQPNIFVLNVRTADVASIQSFDSGAKLYDTILARIQSINGVLLSDYLTAKLGKDGDRGGFTREFNTTTRILSNSPLVQGNTITGGAVSLDESFAKDLGLQLGDRITLFIQGRSFDLLVTSLRKRISSGTEPFFYLQLDVKQFADAPKSWFRVTRKDNVILFKQQALARIGPHLSFIDIAAVIALVADIAEKIIAIVLACMGLIILLVLCVSLASNEASALLSIQGYRLYHILGMPKALLLQKSRKIAGLYAAVILGLLFLLLPFLLFFLYTNAPLLLWHRTSLGPLSFGIFVSLSLMVVSYRGFHRSVIEKI